MMARSRVDLYGGDLARRLEGPGGGVVLRELFEEVGEGSATALALRQRLLEGLESRIAALWSLVDNPLVPVNTRARVLTAVLRLALDVPASERRGQLEKRTVEVVVRGEVVHRSAAGSPGGSGRVLGPPGGVEEAEYEEEGGG